MNIERIGKQAGIFTDDGMCTTVTLEIAEIFAELVSLETKDAKRWRKVLDLTKMEIGEMSPDAKKAWDRLVRGGWYTEDLENLIDALDDVPNAVMSGHEKK